MLFKEKIGRKKGEETINLSDGCLDEQMAKT